MSKLYSNAIILLFTFFLLINSTLSLASETFILIPTTSTDIASDSDSETNITASREAAIERAIEDIAEAQHPMTIELGYHNIGPGGAIAIAEAIFRAQYPMTIYLQDNNIGPEGALAIAEAIAIAQHPMTIELRINNIGPGGARAIAEAIAIAQYPMTIGLRENYIRPEGASVIAEAIARAQHPMTIELGGNHIDLTFVEAVARAQHSAKLIMGRSRNTLLDSSHIASNMAEILAKRLFFSSSHKIQSYGVVTMPRTAVPMYKLKLKRKLIDHIMTLRSCPEFNQVVEGTERSQLTEEVIASILSHCDIIYGGSDEEYTKLIEFVKNVCASIDKIKAKKQAAAASYCSIS